MFQRNHVAFPLILGMLVALAACSGSKPTTPAEREPSTSASPVQPQPANPVEPAGEALPPSELDTQLEPGLRELLLKPFTGDLDGMIERRLIRVGVTFNRTMYFVDKGVQRGAAYEYARFMEERLNAALKTGNLKVFVVCMPMPHEKLLSALIDGKVDLVAARVTVTAERQKLMEFSDPTRIDVNQILVTGPGAAVVGSVDDLSGKDIFVRKTGSYRRSLLALNKKLEAAERPPVVIHEAPDNLEDDDLLEMVNAGLIPAIVVDDYLAKFWKKVFPNLVLHETLAVRTGGHLAVAFRRNSPKVRTALNTFLGTYGLGTRFGDQMERRYLVNTTYVKNAASEAERQKFLTLVALFRKYGEQYDMDFLLMAAQGYQESMLNQDAKSAVGAIGVMQVMPQTGKELDVGDIRKLEPNIHAGVKYVRRLIDKYYKDAPMDDLNKGLFAFASYNAGPARIAQLRKEAEKRGLDPNVWFGNVEQVASERIGRETVTYVGNIYKYYVAYRLVMEENERRNATKAKLKAQQSR